VDLCPLLEKEVAGLEAKALGRLTAEAIKEEVAAAAVAAEAATVRAATLGPLLWGLSLLPFSLSNERSDGVEFDVTEAKIVVTRDEVAAVTGSRTESD